ncbi:MAG: sigma-70 family RNA polymerase sigma factor [Planctomycetes bacterium]|nr:sigma-70 family RNA polymerase sigma factor [Planctomycetota bacterium]
MTQAAFDDLVAPHLSTLAAAANNLTGSPEEAQELVQECIASAIASMHRLRDPDVAGPWLMTILRHKWCDELRRRARERQGRPPHPLDPTAACDPEAVRRTLAKLDPHERRVIELRYFAGKTSIEIGAELGKSAGTVRSALYYALRRFEEAYRQEIS